MDKNEIDETILAAKRFLNAYSPPKKETTDSVIKSARTKQGWLRDYLEEESALPWPDAPGGMYWSKKGYPMQKGFHKHR